MTPFCARILIFPCATLAAGIKATPGSSANGCGLWGVAWAWRQHATQPQETQPGLEPKNQCVHFEVSFTFFPLLEKKSCYKNQASPPPPKQSQGRLRAKLTQGGWRAGTGWPPWGWAGSVWGHTSFRSSALRGKWPVHEQQPQRCQRIVLSLQEQGKPGANLTWFSPHVDRSPIQGCHSYATHWAELRWKLGLHSVSSHCLSLSKISPGF